MPDSNFFKKSTTYSLKELADRAELVLPDDKKNTHILIEDVAPLHKATSADITFFSNTKYIKQLKLTKAAACIVSYQHQHYVPDDVIALISADPYADYAKVATLFYPPTLLSSGISSQAIIHNSASIGDNCTVEAGAFISENAVIGEGSYIGAYSWIGPGVRIGKNCIFHHTVSIAYSLIGNHVVIHPGARIGQDGFGFATEHGKHIKVPQLGRVIIGNDVEIGANTCIDRGSALDTKIGDGCMIDNLVQIGHNVTLGKGCVIVAQAGIAGSTCLEDYVVLGGQAGVAGHLRIQSGAMAAAQSGIAKDISSGEKVGGTPAIPILQWHRLNTLLKKLLLSNK